MKSSVNNFSKSVDFIKRKGKFPITYFEAVRLFFLSIIITIMEAIFVYLFYKQNNNNISYLVLLTIFFSIAVAVILYQNFTYTVGFQNIRTKFSKEQNIIMISEILNNVSLPIISLSDEVIISEYFIYTGAYSFFKIKKNINLIISDKLIMVNIRNNNPTRFFTFQDKFGKKVIQMIYDKINNKTFIDNINRVKLNA